MASEQTKQISFYCEPCGKKMSSKAAFNNHNNSAKHRERLERLIENQPMNTVNRAVDRVDTGPAELEMDTSRFEIKIALLSDE